MTPKNEDIPLHVQVLLDKLVAHEPVFIAKTHTTTITTTLTSSLAELVEAAAKKRGMTRSEYLRHATLSYAAHDHGLQWDQVALEVANGKRPKRQRWNILGLGL